MKFLNNFEVDATTIKVFGQPQDFESIVDEVKTIVIL